MFFYTALIVASVIVALVILWVYHAISDAGKVVYRSMPARSKNKANQHLDREIRAATTVDTRTPWGWKGGATPAREAHAHPAMPSNQSPLDWRGNGTNISEHGKSPAYKDQLAEANARLRSNEPKPHVGWPYREEKHEMAGSAYKVSRKVGPKKTKQAASGKPWGW